MKMILGKTLLLASLVGSAVSMPNPEEIHLAQNLRFLP
jgi:hypothetical protein